MKQIKYVFVSIFLFCQLPFVGVGQELRMITEDFKIPKDSCKIYAYEMDAYLKSKGLYQELSTPKDKRSDNVERVKKKLQISGIDFTKDYTYLVELSRTYPDPEGEDFGEFLIIELGFGNKAKATEVFNQAQVASKKYPLNMPIYVSQFKCVQVENSVLFVSTAHIVYLKKYLPLVESWYPGKN